MTKGGSKTGGGGGGTAVPNSGKRAYLRFYLCNISGKSILRLPPLNQRVPIQLRNSRFQIIKRRSMP